MASYLIYYNIGILFLQENFFGILEIFFKNASVNCKKMVLSTKKCIFIHPKVNSEFRGFPPEDFLSVPPRKR